jgi:hypothetical protein
LMLLLLLLLLGVELRLGGPSHFAGRCERV